MDCAYSNRASWMPMGCTVPGCGAACSSSERVVVYLCTFRDGPQQKFFVGGTSRTLLALRDGPQRDKTRTATVSRVAGSMIQAHPIGGRPIQMVGRLGDFALRHRCLCTQLLAGSTTDVMSITASLNLSTCCAAQIVYSVGGADHELTRKGSFDLLGRF